MSLLQIQQMEIEKLKKELEEVRAYSATVGAQLGQQQSITAAALAKCEELKRDAARLEHAAFLAESKSKAREQGLKAAVEMLRHSNDSRWCDSCGQDDDDVVLDKRHVADFLLTVARIEAP